VDSARDKTAPAEPIVRALLDRSVRRLHHLCAALAAQDLAMHGGDDQIVPVADSAPLSANHLKKGSLRIDERFPHGMCTIHANVINTDLLAFTKG
jgi:hypothetical protein